MPLIEHTKKTIITFDMPDRDGGWYWLKHDGAWEPTYVYPGLVGFPATYQVGSTLHPVHELLDGCKWGDEIPWPSQAKVN